MAGHRKQPAPLFASGSMMERLGPGGGVILALIVLFAIAILTIFAATRAQSHRVRGHDMAISVGAYLHADRDES